MLPSPEALSRADSLAHYTQGLLDSAQGRYEQAASNFLYSAKADPSSVEAILQLAWHKYYRGKGDKALALGESILQQFPPTKRHLLALIELFSALEASSPFEKTLRTLIQIDPFDARAYLHLIAFQMARGQLEEGRRLLAQAADIVREPPEALADLAEVQAQIASDGPEGSAERRRAIGLYKQALASFPQQLEWLLNLALLHIGEHQWEEGFSRLVEIERLLPDELAAYLQLLNVLVNLKERTDVIHALDRLVKAQPDNAYLWGFLGCLQAEQGQYDQARTSLQKCVQIQPLAPFPVAHLAALQMQHDSIDEASATLREGLERMPDNPMLLQYFATLSLAVHRYAEAADLLDRLADAAQRDAWGNEAAFQALRAWLSLMLDDLDDAALRLSRTLPDHEDVVIHFVQFCLQNSNDLSKAEDVLVRVTKEQAQQPQGWVALGFFRAAREQYSTAIAAFEKAEELVSSSPEDTSLLSPEVYFYFGAALEREGQIERAASQFEKCLELEPDHADALNYLAYMWAERGVHLNRAERLATRALQIDPLNPAFLDTLGWVYYMQQKNEEALEKIEEALDLLPEDSTICEHYGDVLERLGYGVEALDAWRAAWIREPGRASLKEKLEAGGVDPSTLQTEAEAFARRMETLKKETSGTEGNTPTAPADLLRPGLPTPP